jgi:hypothetical protein
MGLSTRELWYHKISRQKVTGCALVCSRNAIEAASWSSLWSSRALTGLRTREPPRDVYACYRAALIKKTFFFFLQVLSQ